MNITLVALAILFIVGTDAAGSLYSMGEKLDAIALFVSLAFVMMKAIYEIAEM